MTAFLDADRIAYNGRLVLSVQDQGWISSVPAHATWSAPFSPGDGLAPAEGRMANESQSRGDYRITNMEWNG